MKPPSEPARARIVEGVQERRDDLPVVEGPLVDERRARRVARLVREGGLHDRREVGVPRDHDPVAGAGVDAGRGILVRRLPADERALADGGADPGRDDVRGGIEAPGAARGPRDEAIGRRVVERQLAADDEARGRIGPRDRRAVDCAVSEGAHVHVAGVAAQERRALLDAQARRVEERRMPRPTGAPERRPSGVRGVVDRRPAIAGRLQLVVAGAGHRRPRDDRLVHVAAGRNRLELRVVDRQVRRTGNRGLVVGLVEGRAVVPGAGLALGVEAADAPVVRVVRQRPGRRERGRAGLRAEQLGAGCEARRGVDLQLVARGAGNRRPLEERVEDLDARHHVRDGGRRRARPHPREREDRGRRSGIALGVDRHDLPVVGARVQRRRDGEVGVRGGDRIAVVGPRERALGDDPTGGVDAAACRAGRDRHAVRRSSRHGRPREDRGVRIGDRVQARRRQQRRHVAPLLGELAHARPLRSVRVLVDRADTPEVRAVGEHLAVDEAQVLRRHVDERRVEARVARDLHLVLLRASRRDSTSVPA